MLYIQCVIVNKMNFKLKKKTIITINLLADIVMKINFDSFNHSSDST
jgi:hypothetical protein